MYLLPKINKEILMNSMYFVLNLLIIIAIGIAYTAFNFYLSDDCKYSNEEKIYYLKRNYYY